SREEHEQLGFTVTVIGQTKDEVQSRDGIRIATINRVKGLEFKAVFIVGAEKKNIPLGFLVHHPDPLLAKQNELHERSIFYTACSRARDNLFITSSGNSGRYMEAVKHYLDSQQPACNEEIEVVKEVQA
ncbi:MAG: hypothetical protein LUC43_03930, partial [Burkholderiales bacterium]|nr:hypothetical protein [Burkholderiales bacterium]